MRRRIHPLAASLALLLAACAFPTPQLGASDPLSKLPLMKEFDANLALWQAAHIDRYAFTWKPSCFCDTTPHLVVVDGDAVRIDGAAPEERNNAPAGVPGLFDVVRRAIKGDSVTIRYDGTTGVPVAMSSDPIKNAIDDEFSFTVEGWTLDPPDDSVLGELTRASRSWEAKAVNSYDWSIAFTCDCFYDGRRYDIAVRERQEPAVRSKGKPIAQADLQEIPLTIPALFALATEWSVFGQVDVDIDPTHGYPGRVSVVDKRPDAVQHETIETVAFTVR
ncbi:MAG TPA: DUF6174 domain-containing protein [Patescibacteria group bacterium]|nr:DUF6174 domain-containing protein [Patescibacteria group bacterium]